ncbi:MAG: hypothetical protein ACOY5C_03745 [Pseudomonadota bacterium]
MTFALAHADVAEQLRQQGRQRAVAGDRSDRQAAAAQAIQTCRDLGRRHFPRHQHVLLLARTGTQHMAVRAPEDTAQASPEPSAGHGQLIAPAGMEPVEE